MCPRLTDEAGDLPLGFDRLNAVWFVASLLRLRSKKRLFVPFLTSGPVSCMKTDGRAFPLIVELGRAYQFNEPATMIGADDVDWVRMNIQAASLLMKETSINRAFQTFDTVWLSRRGVAAMMIAWSSLECLMRPGRVQITDRISRSLAAMLYPSGAERDRAFGRIRQGYEDRGATAHGAQPPGMEELERAMDLARSALIKAIENRTVPVADDLLSRWKTKT